MIAKLKIVEEEADECGYWLELLLEAGSASAEVVEPLAKEADELFKITVSSIKTIRARSVRP